MVYPTLPRKKQQEPIRENNVDPLAPFPNKKIQNPTIQDPNSKFHIEHIQNPNPQNIQKIYILRGSEMVYPTLPRKKQQEPIRENNVDPLAPFPNKKIQNPTTQDPNSKFHIEQIYIYIYLKGVWNGLPHLATKKTTRTDQGKQCRPPGPFSKQKKRKSNNPRSKLQISHRTNLKSKPTKHPKNIYLKGVWNGLPHLATKKTTRTDQGKQCRPPGPFSKQKNPKSNNPRSKLQISHWTNIYIYISLKGVWNGLPHLATKKTTRTDQGKQCRPPGPFSKQKKPKSNNPRSKLQISHWTNPKSKPTKHPKNIYLKGVWNGLPHLATKKTTRTHQGKQCRPPRPFSKQKNPKSNNPRSKLQISHWTNIYIYLKGVWNGLPHLATKKTTRTDQGKQCRPPGPFSKQKNPKSNNPRSKLQIQVPNSKIQTQKL